MVEDPADPEGNAFAFRHALVHEALSREGLAAQRGPRHRAILDAAEALAEDGSLETSSAQLARHALAAGERGAERSPTRAQPPRAPWSSGRSRRPPPTSSAPSGLWSTEDGPRLRAELLFACGRLRTRLARGDARAAGFLEQARAAYRDLGDEGAAAWSLAVLADDHWRGGESSRRLRRVGAGHPGSPTDAARRRPCAGACDPRARPRVREAGRCGGAGRRRGPGPGAGRRDGRRGLRPGLPPLHEGHDRPVALRRGGEPSAVRRGGAPGHRAPRRSRRRPGAPPSVAGELPARVGPRDGRRSDRGRPSWWRGTGCGSCRPTTSSAWRTWPSRRGIGRARAA